MCCVYVCVYVCVWRERERIRGESGKRGFIGALTLSLSFFLFFFLIFFSWRGERCATFAFFSLTLPSSPSSLSVHGWLEESRAFATPTSLHLGVGGKREREGGGGD